MQGRNRCPLEPTSNQTKNIAEFVIIKLLEIVGNLIILEENKKTVRTRKFKYISNKATSKDKNIK